MNGHLQSRDFQSAPPPGPGDTGFAFTPEVGLLLLGVLATVLVAGIFIWLLRGMIKEDARAMREDEAGEGESS